MTVVVAVAPAIVLLTLFFQTRLLALLIFLGARGFLCSLPLFSLLIPLAITLGSGLLARTLLLLAGLLALPLALASLVVVMSERPRKFEGEGQCRWPASAEPGLEFDRGTK